MKEILVVDSYAKTPRQRDALVVAIKGLTSLALEICLVSHLPIPDGAIQSGVNYVIYDRNNILGETAVTVCFQAEDLEVRCRPRDNYHGAAVYASLCNALRLLAGRYDRVHFVESDIEVGAVKSHLDRATQEFDFRPDAQVVGYCFYNNDPARSATAILTSLFSLRPEILKCLPQVSNWDDYTRLATGNRVFLEEWFLDRLVSQGIKCRLLGAAPFHDQSHLEGEYLIFKCRLKTPLHLVFIVNRASRELEAKWHSNQTMRIAPGTIGWVTQLEASDEVLVRFVDSDTFNHHPLSTMMMGAFKKSGYDLCPDWEEPAT